MNDFYSTCRRHTKKETQFLVKKLIKEHGTCNINLQIIFLWLEYIYAKLDTLSYV